MQKEEECNLLQREKMYVNTESEKLKILIDQLKNEYIKVKEQNNTLNEM